MRNTAWKPVLCATASAAILTVAFAAGPSANYTPGTRVQILSHNAFPDHGKFADRLDRTLASGLPVGAEEDLAWVDGRSLLIHGAKAAGTDDPTIDAYFFAKVKPRMEKALKDGNKGNWPLVTLYLDIKNDPPEHLEAINKLLDKYDAWLTKAEKTADISKQSPLELKPMMVLVEDKQGDIKQKIFYDNVPVGGKIRVFGSAEKFDENPQKLPREKKDEAIAMMASRDPEQLLTKHADNYRRWFGVNWAFIEKGGQTKAGAWSKESDAKLKKFVDYGHRLGYFVSVYCLNGYTAAEDLGWDAGYNFGSKDKVMPRWQAAVRAHADFVSTDQVEEVGKLIKAGR
ncbi:MAG TPA: hypothetical protein VNV86_04390 [Candidatus Acidoferrum sp.]|nr:hypothetical protein [Candidatus Acidoferrum sp.]